MYKESSAIETSTACCQECGQVRALSQSFAVKGSKYSMMRTKMCNLIGAAVGPPKPPVTQGRVQKEPRHKFNMDSTLHP